MAEGMNRQSERSKKKTGGVRENIKVSVFCDGIDLNQQTVNVTSNYFAKE
jgi:hypothetical protein